MVNHYKFPQVEIIKIKKSYFLRSWGDANGPFGLTMVCMVVDNDYEDYLVSKNNLDGLIARGLIVTNESTESTSDGCHYVNRNVELSGEGSKYMIRVNKGKYEVKTNDIEFGEVTGIRINDQFKVADVDYTLVKTNATPFGNAATNGRILNRSVSLSLYDDGWRIRSE